MLFERLQCAPQMPFGFFVFPLLTQNTREIVQRRGDLRVL